MNALRCLSYDDVAKEKQPVGAQNTTVTWRQLPHKSQLAILAMSRFVDFFQTASLQAYMFFQLVSFNSSLSTATIAWQAGILQGSFTMAQCLTAVLWGRMADNPRWGGRKRVLLASLLGTSISCIGVAFSTTFLQSVAWRTIGGALNGGNVGVVRTMVSEVVDDKRFHSRAFLLLPISFNFAWLLGPVIGGSLANYAAHHSDVVKSIPSWIGDFPYAAPSLLSAILLFLMSFWVSFGLDETLHNSSGIHDPGRYLWKLINQYIRGSTEPTYAVLKSSEYDMTLEAIPTGHSRLPFHRIWTFNVLMTLLVQAIFDFHMGAFNNIWVLFLSTARFDSHRQLPLKFTGGLGMPPRSVGFAMAILGIIGLVLQLVMYPSLHKRFGTVRCFQIFCGLFPIAYALAPYLALVHSSQPPPKQATGPLIWVSIAIVLLLQVTARTFALPATIILMNNASPHPSVLGTVHGIGHSVSSAARTLGPIMSGYLYGVGLENGIIGASWWTLSLVALVGWVATRWVREGSGHEIILPGDEKSQESDNFSA